MDCPSRSLPFGGGNPLAVRRSTGELLACLVLALLLVGGLGGLTHPAASGAASHALSAPSTASNPSLMPLTHGDLVIGSGQTYTISPVSGSQVYSQGGNVTVQPGGTLIVRNTTFSVVQFVADSGTAMQRLVHVFTFNDQGTIRFYNSTLTTTTTLLNAYTKLTLNITGTFSLWASSFAFPGWVNVYGPTATLTLNRSSIGPNPGVASMVASPTILGDTAYAPTLSVSGGAQFVLLQSSYAGTYKDNTGANGLPGPVPLNQVGPYSVNNGGGFSIAQFSTPTDSQSLVQDWLYPAVYSGDIELDYNYSGAPSTATATFTYFGTNYPVPVTFVSGSAQTVIAALPPAAITQINSRGMLDYLNGTADFGVGPSKISLAVGASNTAATVTVSQVFVDLTPTVNYNLGASGAGTVVTTGDSTIDLSWGLTPASPVSQVAPFPWLSNKFYLSGGATGFFGNLSVTAPYGQTFLQSSVVIPDSSSTANFYRWVGLPVTGAGNAPIGGAKVAAYYAYTNSQANNLTANSLNALSTADPTLATYANWWDSLNNVPAYGVSGTLGMCFLLVVSSTVTQSTLPDGTFLGGYHFGVFVPISGGTSTKWFNGSVTPYPYGLAPGSIDRTQTTNYPSYLPQLGILQTVLTVNGVTITNATVAIGQRLGVNLTVTDTGNAPVILLSGKLSWVNPSAFKPTPVNTTPATVVRIDPGKSYVLTITWLVSENITGDHGTFTNNLIAAANWDPGSAAPVGGSVSTTILLTILPAFITLTYTPPGGSLLPNQEYSTGGTVTFAGSGVALINATAIAPNGQMFRIGGASPTSGLFTLYLTVVDGMPAGVYSMNVSAYYNTRTVFHVYQNALTIPGSAPGPTNPLFLKFLGLPLWIWIAIVAAIIVGIFGVLFLLRMTARGKLVECGECGELIPEDATACPKCGAEFEHDLVRCSRCSSTIPANSTVCPECAAQLLGKPEQAQADPERQGYADFVERYRAESKKELGDNYSEGAFWDWWKRQPTYVSFSQWRLQQSQGTRAGMGAPPPAGAFPEPQVQAPVTPALPPRQPARAAPGAPAAAYARPAQVVSPRSAAPPPQISAPAAAAAPSSDLKACPNCGKEIPPEYLVCPFCGSVTQ